MYYATFKIKSLQYKNLILNSTGCRKNNRFLRQPSHYRILLHKMRKCYAKVRHGIPAVHHAKFPAQLATSALARSSPRNLQRARSAKFPAQDFFASPITQHAVNVALRVLIRNCSRLSYLLLHPKGWGIKASARIKEKRLGRFSTPDLQSNSEQWPFAVHPFIFIKNRVIYHFVNDI